ncbi:MAG: aminotransferase class I/II-fold pyridoxal phosphate-dependent enzyme [Candidatus Binatia bacterium]|nr:aminotransferase class I/II-fold pyridoxal phosphate-dependent enzyme [Candidatus Binatia bacterium]MDG2009150.1 aminotransferase class I/II-fold pyridoxal phosphate-dependent enzyme [Candidatus Binatia bacterium]
MSKSGAHKSLRRSLATQAVHSGETESRQSNAITTPIVQTSTYVFRDTAELIEHMSGQKPREEYGRYGNPTQKVAETKCAALEGAAAGLAFSSGMSAITTTLFAMLRQGQHIVMTDDCYRRTRQFCRGTLSKFGIEVSIVPTGDYAALEEAIRPGSTRVLISETPTNPYLKVVDMERLADIAKKHGLISIIDSTFATPVNQRPLEHGIDLVLHSATKYMAGHNDIMAGIILGSEPLIDAIRECQGVLGGVLDPHAAYLLIRGLKTLPIRVAQQNASALRIAHMLEAHPNVVRAYYCGLPSHEGHEIAARQMTGFGGVVSFEFAGGLEETSAVVDKARIFQIAPSLGGAESLIEQPALMSFFELSSEERLAIGIKDNLIRIAVGLEDSDDLTADLQEALD